jgi:hypothetical protein
MEYTYQQTQNFDGSINQDMIKRLPDNAFIPNDPDNTDWQNYQIWLSEGNTPLPPDA